MEMLSAVLPSYNLIRLLDDNGHGSWRIMVVHGSWVIHCFCYRVTCVGSGRLEVGEWDEVLTAPIQYGPGLF